MEPSSDEVNKKDKKKKKKKKRKLSEDVMEKEEEVEEKKENEEITTDANNSSNSSSSGFIDKNSRTIFVGNVSLKATVADLKKHFKECGDIESARFRSVPTVGCAVNDHGNQKLVKKICVNKRLTNDSLECCNAYVVFKEKESVENALSYKNKTFFEKTIRIDRVSATLDTKNSVFVGNLPFDATDETVLTYFTSCLKNGKELVKSVRLVRDKETGLGKGFGYVLMSDISAVAEALKLHGSKFRNRELRVMVCGKRFKGNSGSVNKKRSFEGRHSGAYARIEGKLNSKIGKLNKLSKLKKPKHAARKAAQAADDLTKTKVDNKNTNTRKEISQKKKPKHSARKAAQASTNLSKRQPEKKNTENILDKEKLKQKQKKPKHAARKAAQANAAASALQIKNGSATKKPKLKNTKQAAGKDDGKSKLSDTVAIDKNQIGSSFSKKKKRKMQSQNPTASKVVKKSKNE